MNQLIKVDENMESLDNECKYLINQYPTTEEKQKELFSVWLRSRIRYNLLRDYDILPNHIITHGINEFIQGIANDYQSQRAGIKKRNKKTKNKRRKTKKRIHRKTRR